MYGFGRFNTYSGGRKGLQQMLGISQLARLLEQHAPTSSQPNDPHSNVVVVATTSRPQDVDVSLRRPGRLGLELLMKVPTRLERRDMIDCIAGHHQLHLEVRF